MSSRPRTAVREVLESINPFKKKKKKVNPLTAPPDTVDKEAMAIGGDAVMLFREASQHGIGFGGQLLSRRDAITNLALAKQYTQAREQLDRLREDVDTAVAIKREAALHVPPPGITREEADHASLLRLSIDQDIDQLKLAQANDTLQQLGEVVARAQMREDLGLERTAELLRQEIEAAGPEGALPKEVEALKQRQTDALNALNGDLTAEKIEQARALSKPVQDMRDAIERRLELNGTDPGGLYERTRLRLDDVLKYPSEYRSPAIEKLTQAVMAADMDAQLKLAEYRRTPSGEPKERAGKLAAQAVGELRRRLDGMAPGLKAHDEAVRQYFATLKRLKSDIAVADALPEVDGGTSTAWRAEKQAYTSSRTLVVKLQGEQKFREANAELNKCAGLLKALLDKRREGIDSDITSAGASAAKAHQLVNRLQTQGLLKIISPAQQLSLLKALPANPRNMASRIELFKQGRMDEAFVAAENTVRQDVIKKLRGDDGKNATPESRLAKQQWEEAETNWKVWAEGDPTAKPPKAKDPAKIKAVFERMVKLQFMELCKLNGFQNPGDFPPGFPDPPVTVELADLAPDDFGETTPVFPAKIIINKSNAMFGDFKEMMDTILHENAHAWQNMIVAQFKKQAPFRDEDQAKVTGPTAPGSIKLQAELFAQNDDSYISGGVSREAYRHEPLEEQAWTFGGKSAQALLVPPPQRSFDSSKGLKNKFWVVESLTRTASARVRLKERHGIYLDEWEGEKAEDKKLTLEGVPGLSASQRLTITSVVDERTLELDLNAAALRGRRVPQGEVEQEMAALARTEHPGKKLSELDELERKALFDQVVLDNDWTTSGSDDDQTSVVRAKDEVDVEHARLVLDETVKGLT